MRSHYTHEINTSLIGQSVTLCGWVHRRRDHGGLIFIDLRDRDGLVQIVCDPKQQEAYAAAHELRNEYVIKITGTVRHRPQGTINPNLPTGAVEVVAQEFTIFNSAQALPFNVDDYQEVGEEIRLKYRYIDLRRPEIAERIKLRAKITRIIRRFMDAHGFFDIETPVLTKSTPEGARDYLVPSRNFPGQFYALPQSPQVLKQLLMIAGFDRYYQIVRCFRDEDLRADRQPEFTQLDIEMSFIEEIHIQNLMEELIRKLFKEILDVTLPNPFPRMHYNDAVGRFGIDRPDLRNPLELVDITAIVKNTEFKVFRDAAHRHDGRVAALCVPQGGTKLTRKQIDDYALLAESLGAKGLAYIKINQKEKGLEGLQSPILKFLDVHVVNEIITKTNAQNGDIIFFGADRIKVVNETLSALRLKIGRDLQLTEESWRPLWVTDFPMFEQGDSGRWESLHHPFTAPHLSNPQELLANPRTTARAYDMVLNGTEIGGGSIRISNYDMQLAVFEILGISKEQAHEQFGHLLSGLRFGAPPHGGIAFGVDRLAMIMAGAQSIRDVIAFPKTQTAQCPLTNAPSEVSLEQLELLDLKVSRLRRTH